MPSVLPTESTVPKQVDTWGIGTYDSQRDESGDHGEDSEKKEPSGHSLPDDNTKTNQRESPFEPDEWLSYPVEPDSRTVTNLVSSIMRLGPLPNGDPPPEETDPEEDDEDEINVVVPTVFNPDRNLNYPDGNDGRLGFMRNGFVATAELPGDPFGNIQHFHPKTEVYESVIETVADASALPQGQGADGRDPGSMGKKSRKKVSEEHSELPSDGDNPAARADYYDYKRPVHSGSTRQALFSDYIAPTEDSGAYAGKEKTSDSEIPGVMKNEETMENWLQDLGNWWSGKEIEDISSPQGFPTTDFAENINFDRSDNQDGGTTVPLGDPKMFASGGTSMYTRQAVDSSKIEQIRKDFFTWSAGNPEQQRDEIPGWSEYYISTAEGRGLSAQDIMEALTTPFTGKMAMQTRQATNIPQVIALTKGFIKAAGKKDLTKRHVLAYLQELGLPQYLSSDIIRCLKLSHDIHVKDVLDEFPVYRAASVAHETTVAKVRKAIIALECRHVLQPEVSSVLRRMAANLTRVLLDMDRLASDTLKEAEKCFDDHVKESTTIAYDAYCKSCKESGQPCMSRDEWLKGMKNTPHAT